ncbi:unnamed protein product [Urochloa humidicola]
MAPPRSLPELMSELVEEILLRLPPGDPACLVRASLVCKPWCRLLSAPSFHRRYRAFHRAPPLASLHRRRPPRSLPELMAELVMEVLLRLQPDDHACHVRASLICKPWHRLLSAPSFRRRYRAFHRAPPLLGFLHQHHAVDVGNLPHFIPIIEPCPFPKRALSGCIGWSVLDCRHGLILFDGVNDLVNLVVWDPITKKLQRLPKPPAILESCEIIGVASVTPSKLSPEARLGTAPTSDSRSKIGPRLVSFGPGLEVASFSAHQ